MYRLINFIKEFDYLLSTKNFNNLNSFLILNEIKYIWKCSWKTLFIKSF